ncbi:MAG TPA: hypothetical protein VFF48_01080 [Brevundimonas sp.]|nr:hypothetical protein [Brevundimonas sp.]
MKRLIACLALTGAVALAACDDPQAYDEREVADVVVEESAATAADEAAAPVAAPSAVDTPPADTTTLPGEKRTSEESVKPESETLFY